MLNKGNEQTSTSTTITSEMDDPGKSSIDDEDNHAMLLPRCACTWKNCRAYQKAFREAKHAVFDGVIRIKLLRNHPESRRYKECLDRTLGISKEPAWKDGKDGTEFCKYVVARHHFTEQHVKKYDANPKGFSFVKPFSLHGAEKYLYAVNPRETLNGADIPSEALYMQCPNVPSEVVKAEYYQAMEVIRGDNKTTGTASKAIKNTTNTNTSNRKGSSNDRPNKTKINDDDNSVHFDMLKTKEAENIMLKDQLDAMKSQLTFLHDMVEKLQAQHFDGASVYSRSSRKNSGGGGGAGPRKNEKQPDISSKRGGKQTNVSGKTTKNKLTKNTGQVSVPDEINFDDDCTESHTFVSNLMADDYGSEDERTQFTNGTFQSKFKQSLPTHDDDEDSDDDEEEEDETDDYDYAECMSIGASTILSASKSVKSLPRELELDEDDESSESEGSIEQESRSVSSSYHQSPAGSHQSVGTFAKAASPSKKRTVVNNRNSTNRNNRHGSTASSVASSVGDGDPASSKLSKRRSIASGSSVSSSVRSLSLYEVKSLEVTDPYGEKGTYSGSISKSTGMPHGHGRLEYDEAGRWYEGDWKHGRWTGYGVLANGDGDFYEGGLKNDQKHGQGIMHFADGRTFEGRYFHGQMVQGKMTYQDGSTYEGTWVEGMRHGYGRCIFADESMYEGEFKEGEFSGRGKMTWNDGGWYDGQWLNGEMHGRGLEKRADGTLRHDGEWVRGQPFRPKK
jgi:hypothetical protein